MPMYERVCEECGETNEFLESVQFADIERMKTRCPSCGADCYHKKVLSTYRFAFSRGAGQTARIQ